MTNEKFDREKAYQTTLYIVKSMLWNGLLTENEMIVIDAMLKAKYASILGSLYP